MAGDLLRQAFPYPALGSGLPPFGGPEHLRPDETQYRRNEREGGEEHEGHRDNERRRHGLERLEVGQEHRDHRRHNDQTGRSDSLTYAGDRRAHRAARGLTCAQALPVAEQQEEDVVGTDTEQHHDQQRGDRLVELKAKAFGEQREYGSREGVHQPDGGDREHRGERAAEYQPHQHQDQQHGGDGDDLLARLECVHAVLLHGHHAGQPGLKIGAGQCRGGLISKHRDGIAERLVGLVAAEDHGHELRRTVGRHRVLTSDNGRHMVDLGVVERGRKAARLLHVGRGELSAVDSLDHKDGCGVRILGELFHGQLLRLRRLIGVGQEAGLISVGNARERGRHQYDDDRRDNPNADHPPGMTRDKPA